MPGPARHRPGRLNRDESLPRVHPPGYYQPDREAPIPEDLHHSLIRDGRLTGRGVASSTYATDKETRMTHPDPAGLREPPSKHDLGILRAAAYKVTQKAVALLLGQSPELTPGQALSGVLGAAASITFPGMVAVWADGYGAKPQDVQDLWNDALAAVHLGQKPPELAVNTGGLVYQVAAILNSAADTLLAWYEHGEGPEVSA